MKYEITGYLKCLGASPPQEYVKSGEYICKRFTATVEEEVDGEIFLCAKELVLAENEDNVYFLDDSEFKRAYESGQITPNYRKIKDGER